MIAQTGSALYRINLIRDRREKENKSERQRRLAAIIGLGCFGFFILSLLYSGLTIMQMEEVLKRERQKLNVLKSEYQKYTVTRLIVDKGDIELLNDLQGKGVFWTRKLAAMASHLPENYWITKFSFHDKELQVSGFGYVSGNQNQLLVLDEYLNQLRADTSFSDIFKKVQLNSADRKEGGKIAFSFSAQKGSPK
jgi:hypothetical protein